MIRPIQNDFLQAVRGYAGPRVMERVIKVAIRVKPDQAIDTGSG